MLKVFRHIRTYGLVHGIKRLVYRYVTNSGIVRDADAEKLRLSREIDKKFNGEVRYGPMRGYRFHAGSWWSMPDRAGMLLGIYECEVLDILVAHSVGRNVFVDVGAADGYYGVGAVSQGLFLKSYCFEISEIGRKVIAESAAHNGVADRVTIFGAADASIIEKIPPLEIAKSVFLIDIEGAEFDFLTDSVLDYLAHAVIVIEVHPRALHGDLARLDAFAQRLADRFDVTRTRSGARDPAQFPELNELLDHERWLICSEGRGGVGEWWVLTPRCSGSASTITRDVTVNL